MAETYEKRSGKATRQKYVKDRRDKVVQVRMSDAELSLLDEFRRNLELSGVTLKETTKTDRKTGEARRDGPTRLWTSGDRSAAPASAVPPTSPTT